MAERLTPIERAIAGEPVDRRRRHEQRQRERGIVRISFTCNRAQARALKRAMQALADIPDDADDEAFGDAYGAVLDAAVQGTLEHIELPPERRTARPQRSEDAPRGRTRKAGA